MKKETVTYTMRNIPRPLWANVKAEAFKHGLTLEQYILKVLCEKTTVQRPGK